MRVCLVGEAGVGKTTLCKQMLGLKGPTKTTIGLDFYSVYYKNSKVQLWDTAGQERYRSLLPMYLKKAKIILYVISAGELDKEDYFYWLSYIKSNADQDYKIIIIITKCDIYKDYKHNLVYLKNLFKDEKVFYKFNNNISKELLEEIISYEVIEDNNNDIIEISDSYYELSGGDDFRNRKPKCC
jgi:small GTP-binding protein